MTRPENSALANTVRTVFTVAVLLLAAAVLSFCALIGVWVYSYSGSPGASTGDVLWPTVWLSAISLLAIGAVLVQLKWANRATDAGTIVRRSLLALAGPAVVILVCALAAA